MRTYQIDIKSHKKGRRVSVTVLQALLAVIIEGSKGALRLRAEGRSAVRGAPPRWILRVAMQFAMESQGDKLVIESPTLSEAVPDLFEQTDEFPELDLELTGLDYFLESLAATQNRKMPDSLYDKPLLEVCYGFRHVFSQGAESIRFPNDVKITQDHVKNFKELANGIPSPSQVKVVGKLKAIRAYDQTFNLITPKGKQLIKGIAKHIAPKEFQSLLNKDVLILGTAFFTLGGKTLRVEAEQMLTEGDHEPLREELPVSD